MKKVRFESPHKAKHLNMTDSECHSPRPFVDREFKQAPEIPSFTNLLPYSSDPMQRYESSNSSPYPTISRTNLISLVQKEPCWLPSDDLNLSILDATNHEPRQPAFCKSILKESENKPNSIIPGNSDLKLSPSVLSPIENKLRHPPNVLVKDSSFFIRRDNLDKFHLNINPIQTQMKGLNLGKENNPLANTDMQSKRFSTPNDPCFKQQQLLTSPSVRHDCVCHHCVKVINGLTNETPLEMPKHIHQYHSYPNESRNSCHCSTQQKTFIPCYHNNQHNHITPIPMQQNVCKTCNCHSTNASATATLKAENAIEKKTMAIEKYEQRKQPECMEVEKQINISKEKREPTVADLFKIIKLQNEQLQLLQEKVDKFISTSKQSPTIAGPSENSTNIVDNNQHKMSIGVMTSFEMIRTSTVINKEMIKQTNDNIQLQCNRSQLSIKEVVTKPTNSNFLDGIRPVKNIEAPVHNENIIETLKEVSNRQQIDNNGDDKTLNELSLYNVQVENATTPLMSPEQSLYLDLRDYSDSESSSSDHSNVGWTYYNKVMTHVNGMLQHSDMPSSASAMYRNMRQQCVQMQIDKTNISVTKRVKFGDDPLGLHQPHIYTAPTTDTSLKMNQLAAKYLKNVPSQPTAPLLIPKPIAAPIDMSFATRNYMEKHKILQGLPAPAPSKIPKAGDIPRFLDITALKQQPKFI